MRFSLLLIALAGFLSPGRAGEPDDQKAWKKKTSGAWVLTAVETDGVSTAGDKLKSDALKAYPTYLILGEDGAFQRRHSNLAAVETDEGTFAALKVTDGVAQVDVSVRRKITGDLPKAVNAEVNTQELWRLKDADTLERCVPAAPAKDRPKGIGTAKGDGTTLFTYSRIKRPVEKK